VKCHVRDFKLKPNGQGGKSVDIRDGSVKGPSVMQEMDKIGYQGWFTIEGSAKLSEAEKSRRLDRIFSGR